MNRFLLLAALFLFPVALSAQSGWVKKQGQAYVQAGYQFFQGDQFYNINGDRVTTSNFRQHTLYLYGEYGITDRLDVLVSMPLYRLNSFETTDWAHGIGDLRLELKYGILTGKVPVSISIAPEIPTAPGDNFATNRELAFEMINLPTGDGEWNVWSTVAASHSFHPLPLYVQGFGAYNFRTGYNDSQFRDQIRYGVEVGYQPGPKWWIMARGNALVTLGEQTNAFADFIRSDGTNFMAAGLAVNYSVTDQWDIVLQAQTFFDGWHARTNLYSAPLVGLGVAWSLD
ncbi:MAG TPA: hypothetical protein DCR93_25335 [Cytophagales bacterium]|nr:hypothetical protein [Cytophagales bacterium]HAP62678.1 hypothetical protein [Cytophagales bacterium]